MKALNRQQRKAAIWKFVILYFITIILIALPFFLIGSFSNSQLSIMREEVFDDIKANEIERLNLEIDKLNRDLKAAANLIDDNLNASTITSADVKKILEAKKLIRDIKKNDLPGLGLYIEDL